MEDSSFSTSVSEVTPTLPGISQSGNNSHSNVSDVMLKDMAEKLESLGSQLSGIRSEKTSRTDSNMGTEDHEDVLIEQKILILKLGLLESLENADMSLGLPKHSQHLYNLLKDLINARNEKMKRQILLNDELLKEQERKNSELRKELNVKIKLGLVKIGDEGFGDQDKLAVKEPLDETKDDLDDILNIISSTNDDTKAEFSSFMSVLVNAYVDNSDNSVEDRFVQLPVTSLTNTALRCLLQKKIVVQHPEDLFSFRLSID